ncbi:MAG: dehydrogenase subunit [Thermoplasmata archaeon]|jgi:NADH-quinone oxidoreductase subunit N|nr:dehydrogenase subunit [Thermoplasmata archaeon]
MITPDYAALLPAFILVGVGALLPLIGAFRARPGLLAGIATLGILAAGVLTVGFVTGLPGATWLPKVGPAIPPVMSFQTLEMTPFVVLFDLVFLAVALMVVLASPRYINSRHQGEYYGLIILSTVGMMMVAASVDLITLFVGLELSSFCTYALAGFFKRRLDSSEAAMKYFLIGSISSSLAIFGISMVYALTGGTSFASLASLWGTPLQLNGGGTSTIGAQLLEGRFTLGVFVWGLLLAGFGYKIALVPFHNYAVDVYEGAPDTVSGFIAAGGKQMGFAALFKVFLVGMFAVKLNWDLMVGFIAMITMIVGNVAALQQTNIKRMLAYSSIAQAGYILLALAVGTPYALAGGLFHIVTYSFMKAGAFLALAAVATWGIGEELSDWRGMGRKAPFVALCMTLFMLSFAGIPPLAGFASKFVLFSSAIQAGVAATGPWYGYALFYFALAVVGILTSAISLVYYWRVIRVMYIEEGEGRRMQVAPSAAIAVFIAAAGTVVIGLYPTFVYNFAADAATHVFTALTGGFP